ncbi:PIF1-like helicase-domain-containing protein [Catenaria anguillulae PL171]|uniref:ATP-dependent DNA helicase n=1 Tax=Catenaria anguillulae PL171 TaxID=765915 RepID=A0A1Y2HLA1_9FUNG|nr:PIF1-like helicase-domain-containing protein [Catenaria anguillulae PL171]
MSGGVVLTCAFTGIAASSLKLGRTAHSTFNISINRDDLGRITCRVTRNSMRGLLLRVAHFLIWDELGMMDNAGIEAVDRLLRDVRECDSPGIVFIGCGDLKQLAPVVPRSTHEDVIAASPIFMYRSSHVSARVASGDKDGPIVASGIGTDPSAFEIFEPSELDERRTLRDVAQAWTSYPHTDPLLDAEREAKDVAAFDWMTLGDSAFPSVAGTPSTTSFDDIQSEPPSSPPPLPPLSPAWNVPSPSPSPGRRWPQNSNQDRSSNHDHIPTWWESHVTTLNLSRPMRDASDPVLSRFVDNVGWALPADDHPLGAHFDIQLNVPCVATTRDPMVAATFVYPELFQDPVPARIPDIHRRAIMCFHNSNMNDINTSLLARVPGDAVELTASYKLGGNETNHPLLTEDFLCDSL